MFHTQARQRHRVHRNKSPRFEVLEARQLLAADLSPSYSPVFRPVGDEVAAYAPDESQTVNAETTSHIDSSPQSTSTGSLIVHQTQYASRQRDSASQSVIVSFHQIPGNAFNYQWTITNQADRTVSVKVKGSGRWLVPVPGSYNEVKTYEIDPGETVSIRNDLGLNLWRTEITWTLVSASFVNKNNPGQGDASDSVFVTRHQIPGDAFNYQWTITNQSDKTVSANVRGSGRWTNPTAGSFRDHRTYEIEPGETISIRNDLGLNLWRTEINWTLVSATFISANNPGQGDASDSVIVTRHQIPGNAFNYQWTITNQSDRTVSANVRGSGRWTIPTPGSFHDNRTYVIEPGETVSIRDSFGLNFWRSEINWTLVSATFVSPNNPGRGDASSSVVVTRHQIPGDAFNYRWTITNQSDKTVSASVKGTGRWTNPTAGSFRDHRTYEIEPGETISIRSDLGLNLWRTEITWTLVSAKFLDSGNPGRGDASDSVIVTRHQIPGNAFNYQWTITNQSDKTVSAKVKGTGRWITPTPGSFHDFRTYELEPGETVSILSDLGLNLWRSEITWTLISATFLTSGEPEGVPVLSISVDTDRIVEGSFTPANLTLELSRAVAEDVFIYLAVSPNSTATAGDDFLPIPWQVVIPSGQTSFLYQIPVYDDLINEFDETVEIEITSVGSNATIDIGEATAAFVIEDNDNCGQLICPF